VVLELSRLRIAQLLGFEPGLRLRSWRATEAGLTNEKILELGSWPTSERYEARERSCLALTEQFIMDANAVTEEMVADVLRYFSPEECYTFVQAISAFETFQRGCLTLGVDDSPESAWLAAPDVQPLDKDVQPLNKEDG
jgi:alkylhydroperoxidase family enzyme